MHAYRAGGPRDRQQAISRYLIPRPHGVENHQIVTCIPLHGFPPLHLREGIGHCLDDVCRTRFRLPLNEQVQMRHVSEWTLPGRQYQSLMTRD